MNATYSKAKSGIDIAFSSLLQIFTGTWMWQLKIIFGLQDFTLDKAIKQVILLDDNVQYILIFPQLGRTDLLVRIIELLCFLESNLLYRAICLLRMDVRTDQQTDPHYIKALLLITIKISKCI